MREDSRLELCLSDLPGHSWLTVKMALPLAAALEIFESLVPLQEKVDALIRDSRIEKAPKK